MLNHRQNRRWMGWRVKTFSLSVGGVFFLSQDTNAFSLSWKGDICQVCSWQKIWATQREINTQSSGGWIYNQCLFRGRCNNWKVARINKDVCLWIPLNSAIIHFFKLALMCEKWLDIDFEFANTVKIFSKKESQRCNLSRHVALGNATIPWFNVNINILLLIVWLHTIFDNIAYSVWEK